MYLACLNICFLSSLCVKRPKPNLYSVYPDEEYITKIIDESVEYFKLNRAGPQSYLKMYEKYYYLLDGTAERELDEFFALDPQPYLREFSERIHQYEVLHDELLFLRRDIPLNMVLLDCAPLNDALCACARRLRARIVEHFVMVNRKWNREICNVYEEMAARSSETPETTAQLVELISYIQECRDSAMLDLRLKARTTAEYVLFLMDHAHLSNEDINLNTRVFQWPFDMEENIDLTLKTLNTKKTMAEDKLSRKAIFEEKLKRHEKDLDLFRRFDPPLLNIDLLTEVVGKIDEIHNNLLEDKREADDIINEETLLEQEVSVYFSLQSMLAGAQPFHKLWHTARDFYEGYQLWSVILGP
ncbi:hypothetical protein JYU34_013068 [Plutella xylostella]|uniref:Uncharacterized protein n=1 Tax=Plutella xylostella TaxID=51655 RepID=A0ABQ7QDB9_PLUXY|nr:hypothetical protein JYU34_013068 [Plutella xylostella]